MRIPQSWQDIHRNGSLYCEHVEVAPQNNLIRGNFQLKILCEATREGFTHGCSYPDVIKILASVAHLTPDFPDIIAFLQPTRKQQLLRPVWGRFLYHAKFGKHEGTAIMLEAQELGAMLKWPKRMTVADRAEYDNLVTDGHNFVETKRHFQAELVEDAVRNTILYRTLLHELGHLAHYHQDVLDDRTALSQDREIARELYFSKPSSEREVFAHSFSDKLRRSLKLAGEIPFDPLELGEQTFKPK